MMMHTPTSTKNGGTLRVLLFCIAALLCMGALAAPVLADAPVAAFTATPVTGNSPLTVTFTDQSTNTPTSWLWDFGDGTTSTDQNPVHLFNLAGKYTVKLTATNGDGSDGEIKENFISAKCNLEIGGIPVPGGGANVFANEPQQMSVTMVKNTVGNSPPVTLYAWAIDGSWSTTVTIPAMNVTTGTTINLGEDSNIRNAGELVRYVAVINPDGTVPETSFSTNLKSCPNKTVIYNGYKGVQFWNGKTAPQTYLTYDIHGDVIHSFGDSMYKSGKGGTWPMLAWNWGYNATNPIAEDIQVPAGATITAARLYIPYCWDYEHEIGGGLTTTKFNGVTVTPVHMETDTSNFGAYAQYEYGLVTYDVTSLYVKNSTNGVQFYRHYDGVNYTSPYITGQPGSLSPAGFTLMVVYEDQSKTRKQIFINEGWDLLGAAQGSYATTEEEATDYQSFTGMTIDMGSALKANLTTFVPWGAPMSTGDTGEGNLYVNGVEIGHNVWNYGGGSDTWGESGQPQVAVDTRDILGNLNAGGTGNGIAIQSTAGASPCMVAERAFLVVEYPSANPAPVADFYADLTAVTAGQLVHFTDISSNNPTSWAWDFNNDGTVDNSTAQNPVYAYVTNGTYSVKLTATNAFGSDDEVKTGYITATGVSLTALPGYVNIPKDLNGDRLYEDLNGSGGKNMGDVVLFFNNVQWMKENEPYRLFDFNGNGRIDLGDVIILFNT